MDCAGIRPVSDPLGQCRGAQQPEGVESALRFEQLERPFAQCHKVCSYSPGPGQGSLGIQFWVQRERPPANFIRPRMGDVGCPGPRTSRPGPVTGKFGTWRLPSPSNAAHDPAAQRPSRRFGDFEARHPRGSQAGSDAQNVPIPRGADAGQPEVVPHDEAGHRVVGHQVIQGRSDHDGTACPLADGGRAVAAGDCHDENLRFDGASSTEHTRRGNTSRSANCADPPGPSWPDTGSRVGVRARQAERSLRIWVKNP